jgi:tRNA (guanine37-N1)-methyltransferase
MRIGIITLFPEMFDIMNYGVTGRALSNSYLSLAFWNPRDYVPKEQPSAYKHRSVDDRPYGGGPGMVMCAKPLQGAIKAAKESLGSHTSVVHLSPQGKLLTQSKLVQLAETGSLILIASRYEGVDERLLETEVDEEFSIGDYVLTGGELPAMVMIDGIARFLPGVLGHQDSAAQDSFMNGLLDCPHYTRPEEYEGKRVPSVLLEGNHQAIATWRLKQALGRTWLRRPDLLEQRPLTAVEKQLLNEFIREYQEARGKKYE